MKEPANYFIVHANDNYPHSLKLQPKQSIQQLEVTKSKCV